jgi:hypothetical protein
LRLRLLLLPDCRDGADKQHNSKKADEKHESPHEQQNYSADLPLYVLCVLCG